MSHDIGADARATILDQIGPRTVLSISGGRVTPILDGIELPVSHGWRVRVHLTPADLYTVERVQVRAGREYPHGSVEGIDCELVGEAAYLAGMFRTHRRDTWTEGY